MGVFAFGTGLQGDFGRVWTCGIAKVPECYKLTSIGDCDGYFKGQNDYKNVDNSVQQVSDGNKDFFGGRVGWTMSHSCYNHAKNFLTFYLGPQTW